jgi:hypothetical protein
MRHDRSSRRLSARSSCEAGKQHDADQNRHHFEQYGHTNGYRDRGQSVPMRVHEGNNADPREGRCLVCHVACPLLFLLSHTPGT